MAMYMTASMILNGINILLILSLLYVYGRNWLQMRSSFTVGLLLFAALFLVQNAVSFYFYVTMMPYFADGLEGYVLTYSALQTIAFSVLNWITWR